MMTLVTGPGSAAFARVVADKIGAKAIIDANAIGAAYVLSEDFRATAPFVVIATAGSTGMMFARTARRIVRAMNAHRGVVVRGKDKGTIISAERVA